MGAPKTPLNILQLRGADKTHLERMNVRVNEPTPEKGKATPPKWLSRRGRAAFRALAKITGDMNVLTVADHVSLSMICDAYADYLAADEKVKADGMTYKLKNREGVEVIKANPAVAMKGDAWRRVMLGLGKFGLTPAERANVSITPPKNKNRFDDD